jgi:hypothetical protein
VGDAIAGTAGIELGVGDKAGVVVDEGVGETVLVGVSVGVLDGVLVGVVVGVGVAVGELPGNGWSSIGGGGPLIVVIGSPRNRYTSPGIPVFRLL